MTALVLWLLLAGIVATLYLLLAGLCVAAGRADDALDVWDNDDENWLAAVDAACALTMPLHTDLVPVSPLDPSEAASDELAARRATRVPR